ncbi:uncharacterized protein LOC110986133 isoform X2 [Acanthaster planci]|uniref:Uncharacterized protein LOC110986133 isoform X2 n=1 Tax=Acanthaster planci TaxID=133434 RepID=A0A8B7ZCS7_ACAPL|nr:uncharacterized protein LOC110986133 isoform X2 [Acanthaster planci]
MAESTMAESTLQLPRDGSTRRRRNDTNDAGSDALNSLPEVWRVLLDPSKKVIDDTCLEKLLSWMTELANSPALQMILDKKTGVIRFLQQSLDPKCNLAGRVFALRLSAVLLNSLNRHSAMTQLPNDYSEGDGPRFDIDAHESSNVLHLKYVSVMSDLIEQLLVSAYKSADWQKASIRNAWFASAGALIGSGCPSEITQRLDFVDIAVSSLEDNCLFVVSALQQFLVDLITTMHTSCVGVNRVTTCTTQDQALYSKDEMTSQRDCTDVTDRRATLPLDETEEHIESPQKRSRLDLSKAHPIEKQSCNCRDQLKTCLQKMTEILAPVPSLQPQQLGTTNCRMKLGTATLGVLTKLVESKPTVAHSILADMCIISIISDLLSRSHISSDMCSAAVDFVSSFLQTLDPESELLAVVIGLPFQLMNIHQFVAAIHLASNVFSTTQLSKLRRNDSILQLQSDDFGSLLRLVMLPIDCLLPEHQTIAELPSAFNTSKDHLLQDMSGHKCRCITILCHCLSALERMVDKGLYAVISQHTDLMDCASYILSLTLGQRSHRVHNSLRCHLLASVKVTKAVLSLAVTTIASTVGRNIRLAESTLMSLFLQLVEVLKNPESNATIITKCLDVLARLLPAYASELKHTDPMIVLGETMTKRLCDPQWAIRDSAICFLQSLLNSQTDAFCDWFKYYKFHVHIVDCIHDGESFVNATAMSALVDISRQQELWLDLLQQTGKTECSLVGEFVNFILDDSQGSFMRRATVNAFTKWLSVFPWLQTGLRVQCQDSSDKLRTRKQASNVDTLADVHAGPRNMHEKLSMASQIRCAISSAMFDRDWEVKHGALIFWQTLLEMYLPTRNDTTPPDMNRRIQNSQRDLPKSHKNDLCEVTRIPDDPTTSLVNFVHVLKEEALIGRLAAVLEDEDPTVARRACQMLLDLYKCLQTEMAVSGLNDSSLAEFMEKTQVELREMNLVDLLKEKTRTGHINGEKPLSLIHDILAGTEESDSKFLDCY